MSSNAVPPSVTPPSPNEWPNTILPITHVSRDTQALITCPSHGFVAQDIGVTTVMFLQIKGMIQLNHLPGLITGIPNANTFNVNIDTTSYFNYTSGGVISIVTGHPPAQTVGFQTFNTPFQNIA